MKSLNSQALLLYFRACGRKLQLYVMAYVTKEHVDCICGFIISNISNNQMVK